MPPINRNDCNACVQFARLDEKFHAFEEEKKTMWKKIDGLSEAIGIGKNWIIGIMVTLCLNLLAAFTGVVMLILRLPKPH